MKDGIVELISEQLVVLDGGMGTLLNEKGLSPEDVPEEWNILNPEVIKGIHLDYLTAGAQIIETNTFGGSPIKMAVRGKENIFEDVNRRGVELALSAREIFDEMRGSPETDERFIAGSVGPVGKMLEFDVSLKEVERAVAMQGRVLVDAGVDLLIVETMLDLREAELAVRILTREVDVPVFASMVFNKTKRGEYKTLYGNTISQAVDVLLKAGAKAVGTNCGLIEEYIDVIREMRSQTEYPLLLYPNAGIPRLKDGFTYYEQTPDYMVSFLDRSIEAGANIIGGCCGTTMEYIKLIAERIKGRRLGF